MLEWIILRPWRCCEPSALITCAARTDFFSLSCRQLAAPFFMQPDCTRMVHLSPAGLAALLFAVLLLAPSQVLASPPLRHGTSPPTSAAPGSAASRLVSKQTSPVLVPSRSKRVWTRSAIHPVLRRHLSQVVRMPKRNARLRTSTRMSEPQTCRCRQLPEKYRGVCFYYVHPSKVYCERRTCQAKFVCHGAGLLLCMKRHITQRIVQFAPHRCRTIDIPCGAPKATMYVPYAVFPHQHVPASARSRPDEEIMGEEGKEEDSMYR